MSSLRTKLKHEVRELVPVTAFFLLAFQLLALTHALMLEEYGIHGSSSLSAAILALVVAKVVVVADHVRFVNRFPDRPLIFNVVWKTAIYFAASLVVRYVEHLLHFRRLSANVAEANRRMLDEIVWPHFWGVQLWLLVLLLVFCAVRELGRTLGPRTLPRMFFGDSRPAISSK
jgi:hypothetical protein